MIIKNKLIANMLITTVIVIGISLAGFSSMSFLQERISFIAEKSSPFQMATIEFQKDLQVYITDLIELSTARNTSEYNSFRKEAEKSLGKLLKSQDTLEKMNASRLIDLPEELKQISAELFAAAEQRIQSDTDVSAANANISEKMKKTSTQLKELETFVRKLQVTRSALFAKALENNLQISARLRELENLQFHFKDILSVTGAANNAKTFREFLIAKGKAKTILVRIARNKSSFAFPDFRTLSGHVIEFLDLQERSILKNDNASRKWALSALEELTEITNRLQLTLNQEIELATSQLRIETDRQRIFFNESNKANEILLANSELVTMSLMVKADTNSLFKIESASELEKLDLDIRSLFTRIDERVKKLERSMAELNAREELKIFHAAISSLANIRNTIYSDKGILFTLKKKLDAIQQSKLSAEKLHAIVIKQTVKANESVSAAKDEQAKSIASVNNMILLIRSQIGSVSIVAIIITTLLGFWMYRSVVKPLGVVLGAVRRQQELGKEKATLAEAVAGGDLTREVIVSAPLMLDEKQINKDEMGEVLQAIVGMSEAQVTLDRAFAGMTASLRINRDEDARRDRLKSGLHELDKILRIDRELDQTANSALAFMADFVGARVGILYFYEENLRTLETLATYAVTKTQRLKSSFRLGEGLVGQVALEKKMICLDAIPPDYLVVASALGKADPLNIVIVPIMYKDRLAGVLELGSFRVFKDNDFEFLSQSLEAVAVTLYVRQVGQA